MEKKFQKSSKKFYCKKCDYSSNRESQWRRHLSTTKHKMDNMDNTLDNVKVPNDVSSVHVERFISIIQASVSTRKNAH